MSPRGGARRLGRSDVEVPRLGFGGAPVGNLFTAVEEDVALEAVRTALAEGITYVDTAPHYGTGLSEERIGRALRGVPRERFVLGTKVGRLVEPVEEGAPAAREGGFDVPATRRWVWDFSAAGVRRSLEESLERLGLDRVDVLLVHDPDEHLDAARAGALPELLRMREEGLVRAVGAGMNSSAHLTSLVEEFDLDVVLCAGQYDLLEQPALDDLLPACAERGVSVLAAAIFNSGLLAAPRPPEGAMYDYAPASAELLGRVHRMADVCEAHGVTLPQVAMAFPLAHPVVAGIVVGMRTEQEVRSNLEALEVQVPDQVWADLRSEGLLDERAAVPRRVSPSRR